MATRVELPKDMMRQLIDQGIQLRNRQRNGALNDIIKQALEQELQTLQAAKNTLTDIK